MRWWKPRSNASRRPRGRSAPDIGLPSLGRSPCDGRYPVRHDRLTRNTARAGVGRDRRSMEGETGVSEVILLAGAVMPAEFAYGSLLDHLGPGSMLASRTSRSTRQSNRVPTTALTAKSRDCCERPTRPVSPRSTSSATRPSWRPVFRRPNRPRDRRRSGCPNARRVCVRWSARRSDDDRR